MSKNIAILIDKDIEYPEDYNYYLLEDIDNLSSDHENIYIGDLLDYVAESRVVETLNNIVDKLEKHGRLHIKGPDILQLCWYVSRLNMDLLKFKNILYENGRISCNSLDEVVVILGQIPGIKIESASYVNAYEYSITIGKYE